jgi:hypothetical protein
MPLQTATQEYTTNFTKKTFQKYITNVPSKHRARMHHKHTIKNKTQNYTTNKSSTIHHKQTESIRKYIIKIVHNITKYIS